MSWQRLESSAVDPTLREGLEGRVADPLWLLARQWQSGEFRGEDAADPLLIRVVAGATSIDELRLGEGRSRPLDPDGPPLEALVEAEPVRRGPAGPRVAAELGWVLLGALARSSRGRLLAADLRRRYPLRRPADDGLDPAGRRWLDVLLARSLDGAALAAALLADPDLAAGLVAGSGAGAGADASAGAVTALLADWASRSAAAFVEPGAGVAWDTRRLEYRFELRATATGTQLPAADYGGGSLSWFHLDVADRETPAVGAARRELTVLPVPLRYAGMPADRFWEFEEHEVFFGGIEAGPTDLARVALAGYAINYSVDWYLVPLRATAGSLVRVLDLEVVDTFGATTRVRPAAVVDGPDRAFRFFELTGDRGPDVGLAPLLPVLPTVEAVPAPRPLEDVRFLRDESANLAWAVEQRIEAVTGRPVDLAARGRPAVAGPPADADPEDRWPFVLWTGAPDTWVPLVPVRLGADGAMLLQRGRRPAPLGTSPDMAGAGAPTTGARGRILNPRHRFLLHEEEIPREGLRVVRQFQAARTAAGGAFTWVGRRKGPGRGDGESGLVFDDLDAGTTATAGD